jgi:hypothetical protein
LKENPAKTRKTGWHKIKKMEILFSMLFDPLQFIAYNITHYQKFIIHSSNSACESARQSTPYLHYFGTIGSLFVKFAILRQSSIK